MNFFFISIFISIAVNAYSQPFYQIINRNVQLILSSNIDSNNSIIEKLKIDTLCKDCYGLSISDNSGNLLPASIYSLDWVEYIEINFRYPILLTKELSKCAKLKSIMVISPIGAIDDSLILPKLESFSAINFGMKKFPKAIFLWSNLKFLNLQNGNFKCLPEKIDQLYKLEHLNISNNKIEKLPEQIGNLHNLKSLGISQNNLRTLPASICNLKKLRNLYAIKNPKLEITPNQKKCLNELDNFEEMYFDK